MQIQTQRHNKQTRTRNRNEEKTHNNESAVKRPRFNSCGWTDDHVKEFVETLPTFKKLKALDLERNRISDDGALMLATWLKALFVPRHNL